MKIKLNHKNCILCTSTLYVLFRCMPIFQGYLRVYTDIFIIMLGFLALFPIKKGKKFNNNIILCCIWILFLIMQMNTRNDGFVNNIILLLRVLYPIILALVLLDKPFGKKIMIKLFYVAVIGISITEITTIIGLQIYPNAARLAINGDTTAISQEYAGMTIDKMARMNIGGYSVAYMSPVITCLLFGIYKNKRLKMSLFVMHCALTLFFLFEAQFTIAIILYVVTLVALCFSQGNIKKALLMLFVVICFCSILTPFIGKVFLYLAENVDSYTLKIRFKDIYKIFSGETLSPLSDLTMRMKVYMKSINAFIKNPILGTFFTQKTSGGHSAILDFIAIYGFVGISMIFVVLFTTYNKLIVPHITTKNRTYIICAIIMFILYAVLNLAFNAFQFMWLTLLSIAAGIIMEGEKNNESSLVM